MLTVRGYHTSAELFESEQSLVLRATREADGAPVVLKMLKDVRPPPERIARFKREFELVGSLDLPGVVRALDFFRAEAHWLFVQEDFGGESLARLGLAGRVDLDGFLAMADALAGHVAAIHQRAIIHKDLTPANIVLEPRSGTVKLIDFGIATRLSRETVAFDHLSLIEGTPAYLSPEQTGRINQPLDHRTDLYTLGCTLYELLTGRPPFETADLVELIHCHLARIPEAVDARRPDVPHALSAVVDKLLAKDPSERYQTALGLQADLQRCRSEWQRGRTIHDFHLADRDIAQRLSPPARLYGRAEQTAVLMASFERAAAGGTELLMVSGAPGIGKSALVKDLYQPVTRRRGFFTSGKFDQLQRDTPYGPVLSALDGLIGQILMEPPERMAAWARTLQVNAGGMLPALVGILPRLAMLYDRLPPTLTLPPAEHQARFLRALAGFIRTFASAAHPLVLFIDDLQWADSASLGLLAHLTTAEPIPYTLILGAYRHEEVPPAHPLRATLRDIRAAGVEVRDTHLDPLTVEDTAALLADALRREPAEVGAPARLIHGKTGGNPFFVQAFLDALVAERAVFFEDRAARWEWDEERLRLLDLSDNVVELLVANLQRLPAPTRQLLTQAACIGSRFELSLLATVAGMTVGEVAGALSPALIEGYLVPMTGDYRLLEAGMEEVNARLDVAYKFAHDRIQQAAYDLAPAGAHASIHLQIGRGMRTLAEGRPGEPPILAIANQLNQAKALVDDPSERLELAALNLDAGRKAKAAAATEAARGYFEHGLAYLSGLPHDGGAEGGPGGGRPTDAHDLAFGRSYPLALALTEESAEVAYLMADFETTGRRVDALLRHAEQSIDRVKAIQVRINAQLAENRFSAAIASAREILPALGVDLPLDPTDADVDARFDAVAREMGDRSPSDLAKAPDMIAPEPIAAMRLLNSLFMSTFLAQPRLSIVISAEMVLLSLRHGLAEESGHGFIFYGMSLCGRGHLSQGNEYGVLAELLVEARQRKGQIPDLAVLGSFYIFHWQRPVRQFTQRMRDGYLAGLESGYLASGSNCLQCSSWMAFLGGGELEEIVAEYAENSRALERHKQGPFLNWLRVLQQAVRNLRAPGDDPTHLRGDVYDEVAEIPVHQQTGDLSSIYLVSFLKVMLCYHFHDHQGALQHARSLEGGNQPGSVLVPLVYLYQCLALLALHDDAPPQERRSLIEEAEALVERMKSWGESCPVNYAHKHHLMAAELARACGRLAEARDHYDRAIDLAREHEYTQEEALALERAALFYLEQRNPRLAGYYLRDAYYTYGRWGSAAKQGFLRRRYGYLLEREQGGRARGTAQTRASKATTTTSELGELDLGTVLSASRAIAGETDVSRLLETVMRISLENAGAERGLLVLVRGDRLLVKVRSELGEDQRFESISVALDDQEGVARSVVQYVARTAEVVLLEHAAEKGLFVNDPHIQATGCKSLLCVPILLQGTLVAISYLENNRATSVFDEDRVDVLTLLMGQAAVSIESALLKESEEVRDFHFQVGGSVPVGSPTYVRRKADDLLAGHVQQAELCYVFNTRQMGKSSLRVRAADRLGKAGIACVSIDITAIGSAGITAEQWYAGIARTLVTGLGLHRDFDLRRWWRERTELSPVQRLDVLVDEVVLERIAGPIAVFIDEVDSVLSLGFSADDLFALIRLMYNRRAEDPRYRRLCFVLFGVATPADLIRDRRRTPFNIGRPIPLAGFRFDEARNLIAGLARVGNGERLLRAVLYWSGGQPFLTQKLCGLIAEDESRPPAGKESEWVASLVQGRVIDHWRHRDEPEHLKTIEARLLRDDAGVPALLSAYRRILDEVEVDAGDSPLEEALVLSGLVTQTFDKLRVGNPIYAAVFDHGWIEAALGARASRA